MNKHLPKILAVWLTCILLIPGCNVSTSIPVQKYQETIRVACVGDSITYGSSIKYRLRDAYPAQLGRMLGPRWETRNFGVGGATLLKKGDKPYWQQQPFQDALTYNPHVVIIKLGTNDTKPQNWKHKEDFVSDYKDMIDIFAGLSTHPSIWICRPVPAYPARWGISDEVIKNGVIPLVNQVASEKAVGLIDLYQPLSDKPEFFPDQIHPNAAGAQVMARVIYQALTGKKLTGAKHVSTLPQVMIIGDSISIGYFKPTQQLLQGKADVYHNPGNAQHTAHGLKNLNAWLAGSHWDVIHFNHGLHDLKYVNDRGKNVPVAQGHPQIPLDQYEKNLEELVKRLKKTGAKLIFATTTPVPEGTGIRVKGDAQKYNEVALKVMKKHHVTVNDLYAYALPRLAEIQRPQNVHFHPEGSKRLAEQVAQSIIKKLNE
jgi:lysophospholipase L1-like esterase